MKGRETDRERQTDRQTGRERKREREEEEAEKKNEKEREAHGKHTVAHYQQTHSIDIYFSLVLPPFMGHY